jgi:hypothetical protein
MTRDLKWNFNIANKLGVGFHQYSLPVIRFAFLFAITRARCSLLMIHQWVLADAETVK